jgi:hypothetical protein
LDQLTVYLGQLGCVFVERGGYRRLGVVEITSDALPELFLEGFVVQDDAVCDEDLRFRPAKALFCPFLKIVQSVAGVGQGSGEAGVFLVCVGLIDAIPGRVVVARVVEEADGSTCYAAANRQTAEPSFVVLCGKSTPPYGAEALGALVNAFIT